MVLSIAVGGMMLGGLLSLASAQESCRLGSMESIAPQTMTFVLPTITSTVVRISLGLSLNTSFEYFHLPAIPILTNNRLQPQPVSVQARVRRQLPQPRNTHSLMTPCLSRVFFLSQMMLMSTRHTKRLQRQLRTLPLPGGMRVCQQSSQMGYQKHRVWNHRLFRPGVFNRSTQPVWELTGAYHRESLEIQNWQTRLGLSSWSLGILNRETMLRLSTILKVDWTIQRYLTTISEFMSPPHSYPVGREKGLTVS